MVNARFDLLRLISTADSFRHIVKLQSKFGIYKGPQYHILLFFKVEIIEEATKYIKDLQSAVIRKIHAQTPNDPGKSSRIRE